MTAEARYGGTAFWRVSWREEGHRKRSWQYGDRLVTTGGLLVFRVVDREGTIVAPKNDRGRDHDGPGDVTHVLDLGLDVRAVPMVLDRHLGEYVEGGPAETVGPGWQAAIG